MMPDCPPHMLQQDGIDWPALRPHCCTPSALVSRSCSCAPMLGPHPDRPRAPPATAPVPITRRNLRRPTCSINSSCAMFEFLFLARQQVLADAEDHEAQSDYANGQEPFAQAREVMTADARRRDSFRQSADFLRGQARDNDVETQPKNADYDQQAGERNRQGVIASGGRENH